MKAKFLALLPLLITTSCNTKDVSNTIFVSFSAVKELVGNIIGDRYEIVSLTPPGTEAHDFELTAKTVGSLIDSKALFVNGFNFEHWANDLPSEANNKMTTLSKGVSARYINNQIDPHIWLNPLNAVIEMNNVYEAISEIDTENKEYYKANLDAYTASFISLDEELMQKATGFTQKNIVVSHAAYGYMCDRYGLNQIYINGIEADEEPTTKTFTDIIDKVKEYGITTIFTEELISNDIAEKIASETGVKIELLNTLENIEEGEDYISLMKENFKKLEEACK